MFRLILLERFPIEADSALKRENLLQCLLLKAIAHNPASLDKRAAEGFLIKAFEG